MKTSKSNQSLDQINPNLLQNLTDKQASDLAGGILLWLYKPKNSNDEAHHLGGLLGIG